MSRILVTGGTGYIGSHTVVELISAGHEVVIVDNLSNSKAGVLDRIEKITGVKPEFVQADLRDSTAIEKLFAEHDFDAVIHFAGLKAVAESVANPLEYYDNNVNGAIVLIRAMLNAKVDKIVFSSTACVYGDPGVVKYTEELPAGQNVANPYGKTKFVIEQILTDVAAANPTFQAISLRYFNPIGAHASGLIGEDPQGIPNNLLPFISQVAAGKRPKLNLFGDDYPTPDGTCIRDYIHVVDLAKGHLAALDYLRAGVNIYNLGTGIGSSNLEVIAAFEKASGQKVNYVVAPRRAGDLPEYFADPSKAAAELNWRAEKTLLDACRDAWNWQRQNPNGF